MSTLQCPHPVRSDLKSTRRPPHRAAGSDLGRESDALLRELAFVLDATRRVRDAITQSAATEVPVHA